MIARSWKCLCPRPNRNGFLDHLRRTGVAETSATPGFSGYQILEREAGDALEITLVTYWESLAAIEAFAGEDIGQARLYADDDAYAIVPDRTVRHYEVLEASTLPADPPAPPRTAKPRPRR